MKTKLFVGFVLAAALAATSIFNDGPASGQDSDRIPDAAARSEVEPGRNAESADRAARDAQNAAEDAGRAYRKSIFTRKGKVYLADDLNLPGNDLDPLGAGVPTREMNNEMKRTHDLLRQDAEQEHQIRQAVKEYAAAEGDARIAAKKTLAEMLNKQFALRQKRREQEISRIEERVKRLREALKKRAEAQPEIVQRRLNDLLSDADGLGWGDPASDQPDLYDPPRPEVSGSIDFAPQNNYGPQKTPQQ